MVLGCDRRGCQDRKVVWVAVVCLLVLAFTLEAEDRIHILIWTSGADRLNQKERLVLAGFILREEGLEVILECRVLLAQILLLIEYLVPSNEWVIVEDLRALGNDVEFVEGLVGVPSFDGLLPLLQVDDKQVLPVGVRDYLAVLETFNKLLASLDRPVVTVDRAVVGEVGTELILEGLELGG